MVDFWHLHFHCILLYKYIISPINIISNNMLPKLGNLTHASRQCRILQHNTKLNWMLEKYFYIKYKLLLNMLLCWTWRRKHVCRYARGQKLFLYSRETLYKRKESPRRYIHSPFWSSYLSLNYVNCESRTELELRCVT